MSPPQEIPGFLIRKKVAEGGFAEIYQGEEVGSKRKVAIKILHPRHHDNKGEYKRLMNEGALGLRLRRHDNIVQFLKVGKIDALPFVVMEFLEGETLRERLSSKGPMNNRDIFELSGALGSALKFMHDAGIYHKDLKPENVMLDDTGMVKVIDFGFAESRLGVTFSFFGRSLEGSPAYMAPELIRTKKPSISSDIYAIGCTLYEAATGKLPFSGRSDREVMQQQLDMRAKPDPVRQLNENISPFTEKLIMSALVKNVEERFKDADQFLYEHNCNPLSGSTSARVSLPGGWAKQRSR